MTKKVNELVEKNKSMLNTFGDSTESKIYTHAIFCQCILPVRSLPTNVNHYEVRHGDASLMIQSGVLWDENGKAVQMEVPSGAKARLLLPYIIDQATRTNNPIVDMGANLHQFMLDNDIAVGGKNRKELQRQVNNIAASSINIGMFGETETHRYNNQRNYRIASEVSFWSEKDVSQLTFWNPTLTISDEFMAALSNHMVLLDMKPLVELQEKPRAMDMYMWLSYRTRNLKRPVKISYKDLHSVFGAQTKALKDFKKRFNDAVRSALPYVTNAEVDFDSDPKHLIIKSSKHTLYIPGQTKSIADEVPEESGVFGELRQIGLPAPRIKQLIKNTDQAKLSKALDVTKQSMEKGKVQNPAGFFTKALKEEWEPAAIVESETEIENLEIDQEFEDSITNQNWQRVRKGLIEKLGVATFNSWIKKVMVKEETEDSVVLIAQMNFTVLRIQDKYIEDLEELWSKEKGKTITVRIEVMK